MAVIELEKKILSMIPFYDLCCNMRPEAAEVAFREMASGLTRRMDV
jgi:hypothetical protein